MALSPIEYVVPHGQIDDGVELAVDAARYLWRGGRLLLGGGGRALLALQLATHCLLLHDFTIYHITRNTHSGMNVCGWL